MRRGRRGRRGEKRGEGGEGVRTEYKKTPSGIDFFLGHTGFQGYRNFNKFSARNTKRKQNNSQKFSLRKPQKDFSSQVVPNARTVVSFHTSLKSFFGLWGNPRIKGKLVVCEAL